MIEGDDFKQAEYNSAFVLMEYFGYLKRDPDQAGYDFWLNILNHREPGNYRGMVCAFITSDEYQLVAVIVATIVLSLVACRQTIIQSKADGTIRH